MKSKTILVSAAGLALVGAITLITISPTMAYQGDYTKRGPNYTAERHEVMIKAFANNDYSAWKALMPSQGRVTQIINQDNFAKFAQAHKLAEQGKYDEANTIRQELGLRANGGQPAKANFGRGMGRNCLTK
jgi:hypothetical protein